MKRIIYFDTENQAAKELSYVNLLGTNDVVNIATTVASNKFSVEVIEAFMETKARINFLKIEETGKNALDFYVTAAMAAEAATCKNNGEGDCEIYIISRDNDFKHIVNFGKNNFEEETLGIYQYPTLKEFLIKEPVGTVTEIEFEQYEFLAR